MYRLISKVFSTIKNSIFDAIIEPTIIYPSNNITVRSASNEQITAYISQFYSNLEEQRCNTIGFSYDDLIEPKPRVIPNGSSIRMSEKYNALVGIHPELYWIYFLDTKDFIAFHQDKIVLVIDSSTPDKRPIFTTPTIELLKPEINYPKIIRGWHKKAIKDLSFRSTLIFKSIHKNNELRRNLNLNNGYWQYFFNSPLDLQRFSLKRFEILDPDVHLSNNKAIGHKIIYYPFFAYFKDEYFDSIIKRTPTPPLNSFLERNFTFIEGADNFVLKNVYLDLSNTFIYKKPIRFDNKLLTLKRKDTFTDCDISDEILPLARISVLSNDDYNLLGYRKFSRRHRAMQDRYVTPIYDNKFAFVEIYEGQDLDQYNVTIINNFYTRLEKNLESLNDLLVEINQLGNNDQENVDAVTAIKQEICEKEFHLNYLKHVINELFPQDIEVI